ncbi:MAG: long-chain fatty acid--CoA ligase [Gammaproteobacteria bacterium]|nr:long-chain fatty acid--CoA ligase [Gammaproteobacteria bacterium]
MAETAQLRADLIALQNRGCERSIDDDAFNAMALRVFAYQYANNVPYARHCERRGCTPGEVSHWHDIPWVPIGAFKALTLSCVPVEQAEAVWMSSGTTRPEQRSRHYQGSLAVYNASMLPNFAAHLLPDGARLPFLVLNPRRRDAPNSSLAHYLNLVLEQYGAPGSDYYFDEQGLQVERLIEALRAAQVAGQPVCLLATSFAFVHLLDALADRDLGFELPAGSRVMDTGGFKGQSREMDRETLYGLFERRFGVPHSHCVNMYGMTEFSSQFLDNTLREWHAGRSTPLVKVNPPWTRTIVIDPESMQPARPGQRGLLLHYDLANMNSVLAVLTEDVGIEHEQGFELLGRAQGTEARGCSIAIDEVLEAANA